MLRIIPRGECLQWSDGSGFTWCVVRVAWYEVLVTRYGLRGAGYGVRLIEFTSRSLI